VFVAKLPSDVKKVMPVMEMGPVIWLRNTALSYTYWWRLLGKSDTPPPKGNLLWDPKVLTPKRTVSAWAPGVVARSPSVSIPTTKTVRPRTIRVMSPPLPVEKLFG
jgi:hypothetical protein